MPRTWTYADDGSKRMPLGNLRAKLCAPVKPNARATDLVQSAPALQIKAAQVVSDLMNGEGVAQIVPGYNSYQRQGMAEICSSLSWFERQRCSQLAAT